MPLYNYVCDRCGPFQDWQPMSAASKPTECLSCGGQAERAVSAPALAMMSATNRIAHSRNEKSADKPEVVSKPKHIVAEQGHGKSDKCGHTHHHGHNHGHGPSRPWMIGH